MSQKATVRSWMVMVMTVSSIVVQVGASDAPVTPVGKSSVECVCVYYPHWHIYPKGNEWFHPGWTEWEYVKDAKPRYPNHKQPMVPSAGYLDGADPKDMAKEIALAANAGIDVFLWDYYWYDGQITQEEALDNGFLKAPNRDRMKFAIMWCYHDRNFGWRPDIDQPRSERRRLMSLAHTKEEFLGLIRHCIKNYFPRPEYWRKDGKLFFSIYNFQVGDSGWFFEMRGRNVVAIKAEMDEARRMVRDAGLGEMHFNIQNVSPKFAVTMKECGFDSTTDYNITMSALPNFTKRCEAGEWLFDYAELPSAFAARYDEMATSPLQYIPNVTTGWDSTPRCRLDEPWPWRKYIYPYNPSMTNNTPDIFRTALARAKKWAEESPKKPGAVYINGWNEYTEGTYLIPNNFDSDGFLRAVASVFGRHPSGEYTFADPITREVFTVPSATFEDLAYGTYPKQKIDVYIPKKGKGPFPVIMYMHGGGWSGGAIVDRIVGKAIPKLLDKNVAVVCTGYRYLRDAVETGARPPVMGCLDDCDRALRFVKAHAAEWNLDTSRIGLAGGSAGACTALYLALKNDNVHGVKAVAPINAQTSMDPKEMRNWIPNIKYGAHAFGYANFDDWLAHRSNCLADIERISPVALLRKVSPQRSPRFRFQYNAPLKPGELAKDPTHSPMFGERFGEIAAARGIDCEIGYSSRNYFGDAFTWLAETLSDDTKIDAGKYGNVGQIVPMGDSNVTLKGFVGRKAAAFLEHRVYSKEAQGDIFDETEHAFETHYDSEGKNGSGYWQGEYWGKTMLGFTGAYRMERKSELREFIVRKCRGLVERFQRTDGAITTYSDVRQVRKGWNLWGRKYTLWGLLESYDATGERFMLDACVRLVDQQMSMLDDMGLELYETGEFMGMPSCSVLTPLLILYERTNEKRFLDYARRIIGTWEKSGQGNPGLVVNALGNRPVHEWFPYPEAWAKSYEMMSCYEGLAVYSRLTGEMRPFDAVRGFAAKLLERELNALWSVGYYDRFEGSAAYASATSEICDIVYWNRLLGELYRGTGDDRWLDLFERSFLNAFLAGVYHREGWASHGVRSHGHSHQTCPYEVKMLYHSCCVDNAPRGFFGYAEHTAATAADGTALLNFYTDAEIRAGNVALSVSGGYPISDKVRIDAVARSPVKIRLRRPEYCEDMRASIASVWHDGRLEIELPSGKTSFSVDIPMKPRIVNTHLVGSGVPNRAYVRSKFELCGGEMAGMFREKPATRVMRGPLLLCKAKIVGERDGDIFDPRTVNGESGWCVSMEALDPSATWGRWRLVLEKSGERRTWTVCDYASAADWDCSRNSFSIWF